MITARAGAGQLAEAWVEHREAAQRGQIARRREVPRPRRAAAVLEMRALQAQLPRTRVHQAHKRGFVAGDVGGQRQGGVIGALDDERAQGLLDGDALAGQQPDAHGLRQGDAGHHGVALQVVHVFEDDERRHDLGARRRRQTAVGGLGPQDGAGLRFDEDGSLGLHVRLFGPRGGVRGGSPSRDRRTTTEPAARHSTTRTTRSSRRRRGGFDVRRGGRSARSESLMRRSIAAERRRPAEPPAFPVTRATG